MAAKLLHSLADENPDLQKQIGCMTGIFQLFDRHPMFIGGGKSVDHAPKLPLHVGNSNSRSLERESDNTRLRSASRDSMYREVQSLSSSTKVKSKGESSDSSMKNYRDEPRELLRSASYHMKEGSSFLVSRDIAPRLSYDGRETRDVSESAFVNLKDIPRLSLDSRGSSMWGKNSMQKESVVELGGQTQVQISQQKPVNLTRPSVVAKLMGLETLPDSIPLSSDADSGSGKSYIVNMSAKTDGNSLLWKEPSSPRWRNADPSMNPLLRFPIEPAPWKHIESGKGSQKVTGRTTRAPAKGSKSFPSVYSEIEKRLKDLEFAQSGKDLRALKQILEAMQSKGFMESETEVKSNKQKHLNSKVHESRSVSHNHESPIVIMKSGNMVEKSGLPAASVVNSINRKNVRTTKTVQTPSRLSKDGNIIMQQKKVEMERRSRPPTPPNPSKSKRQPNKQQRPKQTGDISGESRYETESSVQSNESIPRGSERSTEISSCQSLSVKASKFMLSGLVDKKSTMGTSEVDSAEFGFVPPEYSSPVSVLDKVVCKDDSPSPVKYVGKTLIEDSTYEISRKKFENIDNLVQKLRRLNSTHDEESTDYIASLCEKTNPDHRYVSEILLASGLLLRELGSNLTNFQFHPSGYPINPELFLVLEQTKARTFLEEEPEDTFHRKLIFDTVNEILARKLVSEDPGKQVSKRGVNAQKLLRDLCSEIELLQGKYQKFGFSDEKGKDILSEDVLHQSESWKSFDDEISGAVLDIERLIFKDLVNDVVSSAGLKTSRPSRRRLFGK